jgi:hypothetical protein
MQDLRVLRGQLVQTVFKGTMEYLMVKIIILVYLLLVSNGEVMQLLVVLGEDLKFKMGILFTNYKIFIKYKWLT